MKRPARSSSSLLLGGLLLITTAAQAQLREHLLLVQGQVVHVASAGPISAPTVVFENGVGETLASWRRVAPLLADQAHLLAYNRPGAGRSADIARPEPSAAAACDHLLDVLHAAGAEAPVVLVGHSLGGLYAQACARRRPELVTGLVLVDPVVRGQEALLRRHDRLGAALLSARQNTLPGAAGRELRASVGLQAELAALPVYERGPVLTLVAGRDRPSESPAFKNARRAAMREQTLQYPQGELIEIEDGGAMLHEEQPRAIADAVLRILQRGGPATPASQAEDRSMRLPVVWRTR